jgi:hypothetical protein
MLCNYVLCIVNVYFKLLIKMKEIKKKAVIKPELLILIN